MKQLRAIDALSDRVPVVAAESRPTDPLGSESGGRTTHVAVLDEGRFCGLIGAKELMACPPGWIFADLVAKRTTLRVPAQTPLEQVSHALAEVNQDAAAVVDDRGAYLGAATLEDVRRRLAEVRAETANISRDSLLTALESSVIVAVTDLSGTITEANDAFCRISGYSRAELIGANHRILNSGHHSKTFWVQMWKLITRGGVWRAEVRNKAKDGSLYWVDTTIAPVRDEAGTICGYIAIRIDITARKRGEEKLAKALDTAEAANRAKSEFLANMSHEIRTPMTAILGFAELLREHGDMAPARRLEHIDAIRGAGQHLLSVINDILDVSKIEAGKMTVERVEGPLVQLLVEVDGLVRPRAISKGLALHLRLDSPLPERIVTDPTRLRQILLNLVGNAVKFTDNGRVTISARAERGEASGGSSRFSIDVEDTGPGLTPEQTERLFLAFAQGDSTMSRKFGGSGLGLTISRRLARLMGGDVTLVRTEVGKGSCFRVELPLEAVAGCEVVTSLDSRKVAPAPQASAAAVALKGRILLAEDGPDNQRLISFHLKRAGAEIAIADNGRIALEMLGQAAAEGRPYHLLLTDMQMPEMDGYTLVQTLRSRASTLAIVALTAHAMSEDRDRCLAAGCDDYAAKPIDKATLLAVCAAWMGKTGGVKAAPMAA